MNEYYDLIRIFSGEGQAVFIFHVNYCCSFLESKWGAFFFLLILFLSVKCGGHCAMRATLRPRLISWRGKDAFNPFFWGHALKWCGRSCNTFLLPNKNETLGSGKRGTEILNLRLFVLEQEIGNNKFLLLHLTFHVNIPPLQLNPSYEWIIYSVLQLKWRVGNWKS